MDNSVKQSGNAVVESSLLGLQCGGSRNAPQVGGRRASASRRRGSYCAQLVCFGSAIAHGSSGERYG